LPLATKRRRVAQQHSDFDAGDDRKATGIKSFCSDKLDWVFVVGIHINSAGRRGGGFVPMPSHIKRAVVV
jgi:hypothetical protein